MYNIRLSRFYKGLKNINICKIKLKNLSGDQITNIFYLLFQNFDPF